MRHDSKEMEGVYVFDEGTEGKLRTKQKLTPHNPHPPRDICDIPQALLAALKLRKGKTNS